MEDREAIESLNAWFRSDEYPALINVYRAHSITGTYGNRPDLRAAVFTEGGRLKPEYFEQYMSELHTLVLDTLRGDGGMTHAQQNTMRFLHSTLRQMYNSVEFDGLTVSIRGENTPLGQSFEKGKEIADIMRAAFPLLELDRTSGRFDV